jgi:hypothetical protein
MIIGSTVNGELLGILTVVRIPLGGSGILAALIITSVENKL